MAYKVTLRLQAILEEIPPDCKVLADIGTDHGILPIEAVRLGQCERAIACDINKKPLKSAAHNIVDCAEDLTAIETRLGNGLEPLAENEADCIVIAGMGGMLIKEILSAAPQKAANAFLILQPQHDIEKLRRFLHEKMYTIIKEKIITENNHFYTIITAAQAETAQKYTEAEYFLGKYEKTETLYNYYNEKHTKILGYINSINGKNERAQAESQLKMLEGYINDSTADSENT